MSDLRGQALFSGQRGATERVHRVSEMVRQALETGICRAGWGAGFRNRETTWDIKEEPPGPVRTQGQRRSGAAGGAKQTPRGTLSAAQTCGKRGQLARGGATGFPGRRARRTAGPTDARVLPGPKWSPRHGRQGAREWEGTSQGMYGREDLVLPRREKRRGCAPGGMRNCTQGIASAVPGNDEG